MYAALRTTSLCRRCCCRLLLRRVTPHALHSSQHNTSHAALRLPVRLVSTAITAGSQTALPFTRHLPASAPPVMTNTSEYLNLARELALLSDENFAARLFRFSRMNFNVAERPLVHCHLCELRQRRVLRVNNRTLFNFLHLAHVAGFHELCLEIYYAKLRQSEGSSAQDTLSSAASIHYGSDNDVASPLVSVPDSEAMGQASISSSGADFSLTEHVVDSAYALGRSDALRALAADCAKRLARRYNVTTSSSTSSVGGSVSYAIRDSGVVALEPRDMTSEFALVRTLWRLVCLAEYWKERAMTHGQHTAKEAAERTLEDAAVVYEKYILASHALPAPLVHNTTTTTTTTSAAMSTEAMLGRIARLVRYDTSGDEGEMYFFQLCIQLGLLRVTRSTSAPQSSSTSSFTLPESGGSEKESMTAMSSITSTNNGTADTALAVSEVPLIHSTSEIGEAQMFYAALIATCAAGRHVDAALRYFESVCDLLQQQQQQGGGELVNSNGLEGTNCEKEGTSATASSAVLSYGAASSLFRPTSTASSSARQTSLLLSSVLSRVADYVLYRLLLILQAARDNTRVVALGRALLGAGVRPTVSLWTLLLLSAGELREQRIALEAYNTAIDHLRHCGNTNSGSGSVNEVSRLPMPEEVNEMNTMMIRTKATSSTTSSNKNGERRNWEYLLQTALNALSKCQLPRFEENFLGPVRRAGWLRCTDEFYFCCLLQDAFNATTPLTRANAVVDRMAAQEVPLTEMIVSRLLRIYLRCEAPAFLPTYKLAVHERKLYRGVWLDHLLLWADRRRYFLTQDERRFILNEVSRSVGKGNCVSSPAEARTNNSSEEQNSAEDVTSVDLTGLRRGLQGLRTQLALLEYDYKVQPRDYFIHYHRPALPAPTLFDSRMHFLLRRPHCVRRGLSEVSIPTTEGEARRVRALAEMANLTAQLTIVPQDNANVVIKKEEEKEEEQATMTRWREAAMRVYLTQLVQSMQRSCNAVI